MSCQRCNSKRVAEVSAKCSDMCGVNLGDFGHEGYVPKDLGIGGGDYVEISFCLDCGQLQGNFPLPPTEIEKDIPDEEVIEFFNDHFGEGSSFYFSKPPMLLQRSAINSAQEVSSRFGIFIRDYFDYNSYKTPVRKHPSAARFLQMFKDREPDLG